MALKSAVAKLVGHKPEIDPSTQMKFFNNTWLPATETAMLKWIDKNGNYQYDRYKRAKRYFANNRIAIDVGANLGLFSRHMAQDFETVYCFEPVPQARACLARNVNGNNCIIYPYGLGNNEYETEISYCENSIAASTIGRHANEGRSDNKRFVEQLIPIQIKTLDSFKMTNVDFIKIDIQGYELEMLQGARQTLIDNDAVILVELMSDNVEHIEVSKLLNDYNYKLMKRIINDGIFVKRGKYSFFSRFTRSINQQKD